jgi:hypothetical protein
MLEFVFLFRRTLITMLLPIACLAVAAKIELSSLERQLHQNILDDIFIDEDRDDLESSTRSQLTGYYDRF